MATVIRPTTVSPEYVLAPWYLRVRWWAIACWWGWCSSFEQSAAESPEQVNPLWRR